MIVVGKVIEVREAHAERCWVIVRPSDVLLGPVHGAHALAFLNPAVRHPLDEGANECADFVTLATRQEERIWLLQAVPDDLRESTAFHLELTSGLFGVMAPTSETLELIRAMGTP